MGAMAERIRLLRPLSDAPRPLLVTLTTLLLVESLLPAATALVLGELVGRVNTTNSTDLLLAALAPLLAFALVLLLGHVFEAAKGPMFYLATVRIDGAYRE